MGHLVTALLARLITGLGLPPTAQDEVTGDLEEEGFSPGSVGYLKALTGVVLHVQVEPYRDPGARLWFMGALVSALLLWSAVITAGFAVQPEILPLWDPVSQGIIRFWSASHVTAALAAGLVVGSLPGGGSVGPARTHALILLSGIAAYESGIGWEGVAAAASVLGSGWMGSRARVDGMVDPHAV